MYFSVGYPDFHELVNVVIVAQSRDHTHVVRRYRDLSYLSQEVREDPNFALLDYIRSLSLQLTQHIPQKVVEQDEDEPAVQKGS